MCAGMEPQENDNTSVLDVANWATAHMRRPIEWDERTGTPNSIYFPWFRFDLHGVVPLPLD